MIWSWRAVEVGTNSLKISHSESGEWAMRSILKLASVGRKLSVDVLSLRYKQRIGKDLVWKAQKRVISARECDKKQADKINQNLDFFEEVYYTSSEPEHDEDHLDEFYHPHHHYQFKYYKLRKVILWFHHNSGRWKFLRSHRRRCRLFLPSWLLLSRCPPHIFANTFELWRKIYSLFAYF